MKKLTILLTTLVLATGMVPITANADPDNRQDRRQERGRADERQDRRECRQDEGVVGKDKRDCKQEEVRDGVRGKQGERLGKDDDD